MTEKHGGYYNINPYSREFVCTSCGETTPLVDMRISQDAMISGDLVWAGTHYSIDYDEEPNLLDNVEWSCPECNETFEIGSGEWSFMMEDQAEAWAERTSLAEKIHEEGRKRKKSRQERKARAAV